MIRRPPRSPLFPSTTLFRSDRGRSRPAVERKRNRTLRAVADIVLGVGDIENAGFRRSEEHTSELQSQSNLVCRLLLEKKNKRRVLLDRRSSEALPIPHHEHA